jgi:hypothetical protein
MEKTGERRGEQTLEKRQKKGGGESGLRRVLNSILLCSGMGKVLVIV